MNEIKEKNCISCGVIFKYRTHSKSASSSKVSYRKKSDKTCSSKCSKEYQRNKKRKRKI